MSISVRRFRDIRKKRREERAEYIIEGPSLIKEFMMQGKEIKGVMYTDSFSSSRRGREIIGAILARGIPVIVSSERRMREASDTVTPQGIMALADRPLYTWNDMDTGKGSVIVVLDRIQDPGNLGTVIRTAEAAGATGVILSKGSADPFGPKTVRSSAGSVSRLPILSTEGILGAITRLRSLGFTIYATSVNKGMPFQKARYARPAAVIFGNEARGLEGEVLSSADHLLSIPMKGKVESLNVSVASALIIYSICTR